MSKVVPRILGCCGLLPQRASHSPRSHLEEKKSKSQTRGQPRAESVSQRSTSCGRTRMRKGEDPGPIADPAGICRQVGAEKSHHLAACQANLASLTLERGSRVPPCHPPGAGREAACRALLLARVPLTWSKGSSTPRLLFLCPQ